MTCLSDLSLHLLLHTLLACPFPGGIHLKDFVAALLKASSYEKCFILAFAPFHSLSFKHGRAPFARVLRYIYTYTSCFPSIPPSPSYIDTPSPCSLYLSSLYALFTSQKPGRVGSRPSFRACTGYRPRHNSSGGIGVHTYILHTRCIGTERRISVKG